MSYAGMVAERRLWTGDDGRELRVAAWRRVDGSCEVETAYVSHGNGGPVISRRRRLPIATALWLADALQRVGSEMAGRMELQGCFEDRFEHIFAEVVQFEGGGMWLRVVGAGQYGAPFIRIEWGVESEYGMSEEYDELLRLPFVRALELRSALDGAALVAHDSTTPKDFETRPSTSRRSQSKAP